MSVELYYSGFHPPDERREAPDIYDYLDELGAAAGVQPVAPPVSGPVRTSVRKHREQVGADDDPNGVKWRRHWKHVLPRLLEPYHVNGRAA